MNARHKKIVVMFVFILVACLGQAAVPTNRMAEVDTEIRKLAAADGVNNVLLVFDIDNTLLAMNQPLASNQWYDWQANQIRINAPNREFADFDQLLDMLNYLFSLGHMTPPEPDIPGIFNRLQKDGYKILILTGRAPSNAACTVRELRRNGMDTAASAIGPADGDNHFWKPENIMTAAEKTEFAWQEETSEFVCFNNGILFTTGLNKGQMLRLMLRLKNLRPTHIVFVDDSPRNTGNVEAAFAAGTVKAFLYTREDERSRFFTDPASGQLQLVHDQLNLLKNAIASGDPSRIQLAERAIFGDR